MQGNALDWAEVAPGWTPDRTGTPPRSTMPDATTPTPVDRAAGDPDLVRLAAAGSREAFDVLVERHRRAVYRVCYRFVQNHEDAADLAQDVFVRAYRGLAAFKGDSAFSTWLHRIAVNTSLNKVSVKTPPTEAISADRHISPGDAPDRGVQRAQQARHVQRAIARLPRKQRATVILRMYHELPHEQIAKVLGSSVGAVKANFFHALRNLRRLLEEGGGA